MDLQQVISQVVNRIRQRGGRQINEQSTKASLIDPVLRALAWDLEDLDEVDREFSPRRAFKPVDYAMLLDGAPRMLVATKALGDNVSDRWWTNRIVSMAGSAGADWTVLTNGDEYRIYNAGANLPLPKKLFATVSLSDQGVAAEKVLALLSKEQMQADVLKELWQAQVIDTPVRNAVQDMLAEADSTVVRAVRRRTGLPNTEVKQGLSRGGVTIEFAAVDAEALGLPSNLIAPLPTAPPSPLPTVPPPPMPSSPGRRLSERLSGLAHSGEPSSGAAPRIQILLNKMRSDEDFVDGSPGRQVPWPKNASDQAGTPMPPSQPALPRPSVSKFEAGVPIPPFARPSTPPPETKPAPANDAATGGGGMSSERIAAIAAAATLSPNGNDPTNGHQHE